MHSSYEHIRSAVVACEFEDYHSCKVSLRRALQLLESENLLNKYVVEATNIFGHSTVFDIRDIESIVKVGGYPVMEICFRSGNVIKIQCSVTLLEDWTKLKNT